MTRTEQLIQLYQEASLRIMELIRTLEDGPTKRRKEALLKQINEILSSLTGSAADLARDIIEESYEAGSVEALRQLVQQGIASESLEKSIKTVIHVQAIQSILDETFYSILEATDHMSQDSKQRIEEIVRRANQRSLIEGVSRRQATKDAVAELLQRDITGIIAKNGAVIPADKYMTNVIHYNQRKAHVEGSINRMVDNSQDLVYVNFVGITCEVCAKYQGRVYSISGRDERFPQLEQRPPYHGHCVHSTSAWVEDFHDELEVRKMMKDSNRPFTDNRTEKNIREYEKMQQETSKKNEVRKQWIRYKSRMPNLPDLRTFASQKARNTKLYQQWMADYREIGGEIKRRGG